MAPVYCRITIDGRRVQFSMKRKVEPENWSTESEKAIGKSEEIRSLNNYLDHVRVELQKHYNILLSKGEHITAETIRNSYMGIGEETKTLFESFTYHNENMEARIGIDITKATLTKYETVKSKLKLFVKKRYNKSDNP